MEENRSLQPDDTTTANLERENEAALYDVATRFAECAKVFGARIGPNSWARCGDIPAEALAGCFDHLIIALAIGRLSIHRILNEIQDAIERTRPHASFPFMPFELFDASGPVRGVILERIRQVVKNGAGAKQPRGRPPLPEARKDRALQSRAAGGSNRKAAMELYDTKTPSRQQVSNASTILREFKKKPSRQV